jgi:hypothetical protein
MSNFIEGIKSNKGGIVKKGLIIIGAVAGLVVAAKVLVKRGHNDVDPSEGDFIEDYGDNSSDVE